MIQPQVAISRCLLGERVNSEGKHNLQPLIVDKLSPHLSILPICPEASIGLATPRTPLELIIKDDLLRIKDTQVPHTDHTNAMRRFAIDFVTDCGPLSGAITQSKSPTCAVTDASMLSIRHNSISYRSGFFIDRLSTTYPFLPIIDETLLAHQDYRHRFLTHCFTLSQFHQANQSKLMGPIKNFQDKHLMLLTALGGKKVQRLTEIFDAWRQGKASSALYINYLADLLRMPFSALAYISVIEYFAKQQSYNIRSKLRLLTRVLRQTDTEQLYSALFIQHLWKLLDQFGLDCLSENPLFSPYPHQLLISETIKDQY